MIHREVLEFEVVELGNRVAESLEQEQTALAIRNLGDIAVQAA